MIYLWEDQLKVVEIPKLKVRVNTVQQVTLQT